MLQESLTSPAGCLFPYRNMSTGETDFDGDLDVLCSCTGAACVTRSLMPGAVRQQRAADARRGHPRDGPADGPHAGGRRPTSTNERGEAHP